MAVADTEIEIKLPLSKEDFEKVKTKLKQIAVFKNAKRNVDTYYTPAHKNFLEPKYPYEWLSVRQRGDKTILNYKHWHPSGEPVKTHCDEFETIVENSGQLEKILKALDFKKLVTVDKAREIYLTENFEVVLDTVKELGRFIEIETTKPMGSVEEARQELFKFAKQLGLDPSKEDQKGYPMLLIEAKKSG